MNTNSGTIILPKRLQKSLKKTSSIFYRSQLSQETQKPTDSISVDCAQTMKNHPPRNS